MDAQIKQTMAAVLGIDVSSIDDHAAAGKTQNWDSLRHMTLILALEEDFGVEFSDDEITGLTSYSLLKKAIATKKGLQE